MYTFRELFSINAVACDCVAPRCSHVASASGAAWKEGNMDFTGCQMIVTLKLISAAVSYHDGQKKEQVPLPASDRNNPLASLIPECPSMLSQAGNQYLQLWISFMASSAQHKAMPTPC